MDGTHVITVIAAATGVCVTISAFVAALVVLFQGLLKLKDTVKQVGDAILHQKQKEAIERNPEAPPANGELKKGKPKGQDVADWAKERNLNPYEMGPKNWEQCLWDLKCEGGHNYDFPRTGSLPYQ